MHRVGKHGGLPLAFGAFLAFFAALAMWDSFAIYSLACVFIAFGAVCVVQYYRYGGSWFTANWGTVLWLALTYVAMLAFNIAFSFMLAFSLVLILAIVGEHRKKWLESVLRVGAGRSIRVEEEKAASGFLKQVDREGFEKWLAPEQVFRSLPGGIVEINVGVQNSSGVDGMDARLNIVSPPGWKAEIRPEIFPKIRSDETVGFTVRMIVPSNAQPREYYVWMTLDAKLPAGKELVTGSPNILKVMVEEPKAITYREVSIEEKDAYKRHCISCGNILKEDYLYCAVCGRKIEETESKRKIVSKVQSNRKELEENVVCAECGKVFKPDQIARCSECGKAYCEECAEKDETIKTLGVCSDCEEVYEGEEDYWGWK